MDDDYGADADFLEALAASAPSSAQPAQPPVQQPLPKVQQPTPQRLDKAPPQRTSDGKVVQPKPQALPQRSSGSNILVSPRQRGNPVLSSIRSFAWEYSDIPADYVLGQTTCALFLSLKYHRLHPEYIYQRIRNLAGKYNLRVLLTMVDIPNHEDPLRELAKTALVNNVTLMLCWSAAEAARYLELYKSYEHADFSAIRGQQSTSYAEKLVDFVTVPRSVNKADAIALVSTFGTLRSAVNADQAEINLIGGWGTTKVNKWVAAVEEPFRAQKAAKRRVARRPEEGGTPSRLDQAVPIGRVPLREMASHASSSRGTPGEEAPATQGREKQARLEGPEAGDDEEEEMIAAAIEASRKTAETEAQQRAAASQREEDGLAGGVAEALARLREKG